MATSPWDGVEDRQSARRVKREAIILTAARLFNEKGFHNTSLDEVADRLNITRPTLYYYFKNKDDILFECVSHGLEMIRLAIEHSQEADQTGKDKLMACTRAYTRIVTADLGMCVIRVGEDPLPPETRTRLRALKGDIDRAFRRLIAEGIADESLMECDPKMAAFLIAGALNWIGRWYHQDGALTPDEVANHCIALLTPGLFKADCLQSYCDKAITDAN
jgi:AcrR family transcriptional regulator